MTTDQPIASEQPKPEPTPIVSGSVPAPIQSPAPAPTLRITAEQLVQAPVDKDQIAKWLTQIVDVEVARQTYAYDRALARDFAVCGKFDDIKGETAEQAVTTAMVKIQLGRSWGLNPSDAMKHVYFTNGRPAIENAVVAGKLEKAGIIWDVEWLERAEQHKGQPWQRCIGCRLWLYRRNPTTGQFEPMIDRSGAQTTVAFTEADADHAMIWEKGKQIPLSEKWNFKAWSRDMYYWRCVGRVKNYYAPGVLSGAVSQYEAMEMPPLLVEQPEPAGEPSGDEPMQRPARLRDQILRGARDAGTDEPATE